MLPEQHATALRYDSASDTLTIEIGQAFQRQGSIDCQALLDKQGHLVGVDVEPDGHRLIVMLGEHEDVASQKSMQGRCEGAVLALRGARSVRAQEPNPYWKK